MLCLFALLVKEQQEHVLRCLSGLRPALRFEEASYLNKWDDAPHKLDVQVHNPQNQGKLAPVQIQLGLPELLYITKKLQTVK